MHAQICHGQSAHLAAKDTSQTIQIPNIANKNNLTLAYINFQALSIILLKASIMTNNNEDNNHPIQCP